MFCFVRFYLPCAVIPPAIPPTAQTAAAHRSLPAPANPPGRKTAETMIRMAKYTIPKQMPQRNRRFPAMFPAILPPEKLDARKITTMPASTQLYFQENLQIRKYSSKRRSTEIR